MVRQTHVKREEVAGVLRDCLRFLASDKEPETVTDKLTVLLEWSLDSEHGVELACDLCTRLGIDIPSNVNPLIDESIPDKKRARTFGEVVDYIMTLQKC